MKRSGILTDSRGLKWMAFRNAANSHGAVVADCEILQMPPEALTVFRTLEERVNRQEFSMVDKLLEQIERFGLKVFWDESQTSAQVHDVQVMSAKVSFRTK